MNNLFYCLVFLALINALKCSVSIDCDFEQRSLCNWSQMTDADLVWTLTRGLTLALGTGPVTDHTTMTSNGYYIDVKARHPAKMNDTARIISPSITDSTGCFSLWYHMYGANMGSLNILVQVDNRSIITVAGIQGDQGNVWRELKLHINDSFVVNQSKRFIIESIIGTGFQNDMAVDDITWKPNVKCDAAETTTISANTLDIYNCDFECNCSCQWSIDRSTKAEWKTSQVSALDSNIGLHTDHTMGTGDGHLIYLDNSLPSQFNWTARLISPYIIMSNTELCFTMHYHMFGSDIHRLNVYAHIIPNNISYLLWQRQGNQDNQWLRSRITLGTNIPQSVGQVYQLIIEGTNGQGVDGTIAIDDLFMSNGICPSSIICDFEQNNACGFIYDLTSLINWQLVRANSTTLVPSVDVSYRTSYGHLMFLKREWNTSVGIGRIFTPVIHPSRVSCIRWHMALSRRAQLNIIFMPSSGRNGSLIYTVEGDRHQQWKLAQVTIDSATPFGLAFEGVLHDNNTNVDSISIDDLQVRTGPCSDLGSCDFEEDLCGYQSIHSDFYWKRTSYNTQSSNAPMLDHTTTSRSGFYLWVDRRQTVVGRRARIESEIVSNEIRCISFWYYKHNTNNGQLNVYLHDRFEDRLILIDSINQSHGAFWKLREITVTPSMVGNETKYFTVIYEAVVGTRTGDLAIDDLMIQQGSCQFTVIPPHSYICLDGTILDISRVCDFEEDCSDGDDESRCGTCTFDDSTNPWCGWNDVSQGEWMWTRITQSNLSDHTTHNTSGTFLGVVPGNGSFSNRPARLISPMFPEASSTCFFVFWVYLRNIRFDELNVTLLMDNRTERATLERISDRNKLYWSQIRVHIDRVYTPFQIAIDAKPRRNDSFIAIDDTRFHYCNLLPFVLPNACARPSQFQCARGSCVKRTELCDIVDHCGDLSDETVGFCSNHQRCTFNRDSCDWRNDNSTELSWILNRGPTPTDETGPDRDHTTGFTTGSYIYMESSYPQVAGDRARLISPVINSTLPGCRLIFYYHVLGQNIADLNVYIRFYIDGPLHRIFHSEGERGNYWLRKELRLDYSKPFEILIEGVVGTTYLSDIALDDTVFTSECQLTSSMKLPLIMTNSTCSQTEQWQCRSSNICIDKRHYCDFILDCPDGSDEDGCGPCDFEKDQCGWEDISVDSFSWNRIQALAVVNVSSQAPKFDQTLNSTIGWYWHVAGGRHDFPMVAAMRSPPLPSSGQTCRITFHYWLSRNRTNTLKLYSSNKNEVLWQTNNTAIFNRWNQVSVQLGENLSPWRLSFQLELNLNAANVLIDDVAIDDISFIDCGLDRNRTTVLDCDFEIDFCAWTTRSLDELNWTRQQSAIPPLSTGPSGDHTTGDGYYAYIDSTSLRTLSDRALLISPVMTETDSFFLSFYYHMFGSGTQTLKIILQTADRNETLLTRNESFGDVWISGQVFVQSLRPYRLIFEGIVDPNAASHIAIDDISQSSPSTVTWTQTSKTSSGIDLTRSSTIATMNPDESNVTVGSSSTTKSSIATTNTDGIFLFNSTKSTTVVTMSPVESNVTISSCNTTKSSITTTNTNGILLFNTTTSTTVTITNSTNSSCASFTCYNGGNCIENIGEMRKPSCTCLSDYEGDQCEKEKSSNKNNLGIILGSVFGGVALIAILSIGFFFVRPRLCPTKRVTEQTLSMQ